MTPVLAGLLGFAVGALITGYEHSRAGWWGKRLGRTRVRRADLPVGGTLAFVAAAATGSPALLAAGIGLSVAAIAGRLVDPLPRCP